ncbi:alkylhydroperoxidase [Amycolatopsis sp. WAC 01375]|uniref:carboxymuconolactone decarboxylase family protein n=1 Tax=Amycolatopsis sp. WAC 01375 TaxID=2203194 RepID=UPI000F76C558|nr:carboxymuconolactone decarboxylase family protein [Amycolatopsis sp. WAC 01375]RSM78056.1 alkylhydroperoxidase [Amycolatopsis sp. WAC 01375]
MTSRLLRTALRRSLRQIRYVTPVAPRRATGLVADVYRQVERDFGMLAPPVALHAAAPAVLAGSWMVLRETLVAPGLVDRRTKERVATAVSRSNECPYCVTVHGATVRGIGASADLPADMDIAAWARLPGVAETRPFPAEHTAELVGVAVCFHYLNRMVNVFLEDSPLPDELPAAARGAAEAFFSRFMGAVAAKPGEPGTSLELLPREPLPSDLRWAAGNPVIAAAFASAAAAIDSATRDSVSEGVAALVCARLSTWDGRPTGPSRAWAEEAITVLPASERAAGRLALVTAMASYQVDETVVAEFRRVHREDRALVEVTSWASMAAARRIGVLKTGQDAR